MYFSDLPKDSVMLYSYLNTKLRDHYPSLSALCEDMQVEEQEILAKLEPMDFHYDKERNQFR